MVRLSTTVKVKNTVGPFNIKVTEPILKNMSTDRKLRLGR